MRKKEARPLTKHTMNLFEGDFERLRQLHGRLGAGKVVRELIQGHIRRVENTVEQNAAPIPAINPKDIKL